MASKTERSVILIILLLFVISSLGFTGFVLWQMWQDNRANNASTATTGEGESASNDQAAKEGQLKGTQLANFTPINDVPELQKIDLKPGEGEEVKPGDTVTAHYTGATAKDGKIFESSKDSGQPATFPLANVIQGWQQGVPGMKVGGTRRLVIPAALAYGEAGSPPNIGPNEPLVFDIELVKIGE